MRAFLCLLLVCARVCPGVRGPSFAMYSYRSVLSSILLSDLMLPPRSRSVHQARISRERRNAMERGTKTRGQPLDLSNPIFSVGSTRRAVAILQRSVSGHPTQHP